MLLQTCFNQATPWNDRVLPASTGCCSGASRTPRPLSSPAVARPSCSGRARRRRTSAACTVRWGSAGPLLSPPQLSLPPQQLQLTSCRKPARGNLLLPVLPPFLAFRLMLSPAAHASPALNLLCPLPSLASLAVPMVEKITEEPPPFTVLVHGPPGVSCRLVTTCRPQHRLAAWPAVTAPPPQVRAAKSSHDTRHACAQVGKTTLIKGLIKHYTRQVGRTVVGALPAVHGGHRWLAGSAPVDTLPGAHPLSACHAPLALCSGCAGDQGAHHAHCGQGAAPHVSGVPTGPVGHD